MISPNRQISIGIIGAAGYTGGEMIRLLLHHPNFEIAYAYSRSQAERPISAVHRDLEGECSLNFSGSWHTDIDAMVLCLAHGESKSFLEANVLPKDLPVIDLTADFRTQADFGERSFVYGLPEYYRNELRTAKSVANPGCFATAISLGLLPAVENGWLTQDVHISAITGATGAGQKLSASSHFPWRDNNISSYKVMTHQHLKEIRHQARFVQADFDQDLLFIPYRGNFSRGILATLYFKTDREIQEWVQLYQARYALHPFTHISSVEVNLKQVVNTNKALIHLQKHDDYLVITSVIDNLLKGAAGQAVQNLNLLFDLEETTGLTLKASAF